MHDQERDYEERHRSFERALILFHRILRRTVSGTQDSRRRVRYDECQSSYHIEGGIIVGQHEEEGDC